MDYPKKKKYNCIPDLVGLKIESSDNEIRTSGNKVISPDQGTDYESKSSSHKKKRKKHASAENLMNSVSNDRELENQTIIVTKKKKKKSKSQSASVKTIRVENEEPEFVYSEDYSNNSSDPSRSISTGYHTEELDSMFCYGMTTMEDEIDNKIHNLKEERKLKKHKNKTNNYETMIVTKKKKKKSKSQSASVETIRVKNEEPECVHSEDYGNNSSDPSKSISNGYHTEELDSMLCYGITTMEDETGKKSLMDYPKKKKHNYILDLVGLQIESSDNEISTSKNEVISPNQGTDYESKPSSHKNKRKKHASAENLMNSVSNDRELENQTIIVTKKKKKKSKSQSASVETIRVKNEDEFVYSEDYGNKSSDPSKSISNGYHTEELDSMFCYGMTTMEDEIGKKSLKDYPKKKKHNCIPDLVGLQIESSDNKIRTSKNKVISPNQGSDYELKSSSHKKKRKKHAYAENLMNSVSNDREFENQTMIVTKKKKKKSKSQSASVETIRVKNEEPECVHSEDYGNNSSDPSKSISNGYHTEELDSMLCYGITTMEDETGKKSLKDYPKKKKHNYIPDLVGLQIESSDNEIRTSKNKVISPNQGTDYESKTSSHKNKRKKHASAENLMNSVSNDRELENQTIIVTKKKKKKSKSQSASVETIRVKNEEPECVHSEDYSNNSSDPSRSISTGYHTEELDSMFCYGMTTMEDEIDNKIHNLKEERKLKKHKNKTNNYENDIVGNLNENHQGEIILDENWRNEPQSNPIPTKKRKNKRKLNLSVSEDSHSESSSFAKCTFLKEEIIAITPRKRKKSALKGWENDHESKYEKSISKNKKRRKVGDISISSILNDYGQCIETEFRKDPQTDNLKETSEKITTTTSWENTANCDNLSTPLKSDADTNSEECKENKKHRKKQKNITEQLKIDLIGSVVSELESESLPKKKNQKRNHESHTPTEDSQLSCEPEIDQSSRAESVDEESIPTDSYSQLKSDRSYKKKRAEDISVSSTNDDDQSINTSVAPKVHCLKSESVEEALEDPPINNIHSNATPISHNHNRYYAIYNSDCDDYNELGSIQTYMRGTILKEDRTSSDEYCAEEETRKWQDVRKHGGASVETVLSKAASFTKTNGCNSFDGRDQTISPKEHMKHEILNGQKNYSSGDARFKNNIVIDDDRELEKRKSSSSVSTNYTSDSNYSDELTKPVDEISNGRKKTILDYFNDSRGRICENGYSISKKIQQSSPKKDQGTENANKKLKKSPGSVQRNIEDNENNGKSGRSQNSRQSNHRNNVDNSHIEDRTSSDHSLENRISTSKEIQKTSPEKDKGTENAKKKLNKSPGFVQRNIEDNEKNGKSERSQNNRQSNYKNDFDNSHTEEETSSDHSLENRISTPNKKQQSSPKEDKGTENAQKKLKKSPGSVQRNIEDKEKNGKSEMSQNSRHSNQKNNFDDSHIDEGSSSDYSIEEETSNEEINQSKKDESTDNTRITRNMKPKSDPHPDQLELDIVRNLTIFLPFSIPPLHQNIPYKIPIEGIKVKYGSYSKTEDETIMNNWERFCKEHDLDVKPSAFFKLGVLKKQEKIKFLQYISHFIEDRLPEKNHVRFKKIYENMFIKKGRFSKEEDKKILRFMDKYSDSDYPFQNLAKILNRNSMAVLKRYENLKNANNKKKIIWDLDLSEKLIRRMMRVGKCNRVEDLENLQLNTEQWHKLSQKMGNIPLRKLQRGWKITVYPRLFSKHSILRVKRKIFHLLQERRENDWRTVNWAEIAADFAGYTPEKVYNLFRTLVNFHVPKSKQTDLGECLRILSDSRIKRIKKFRRYIYKEGKLRYESQSDED